MVPVYVFVNLTLKESVPHQPRTSPYVTGWNMQRGRIFALSFYFFYSERDCVLSFIQPASSGKSSTTRQDNIEIGNLRTVFLVSVIVYHLYHILLNL